MDSITQIVLGAAMGEAVLGKKLGNRAMTWGALGGTIPDLDIIGNLFLSKVDALAFHRGISHSIVFSIVGAFLFAWCTHRLYQWKKKHFFEFGLASIFWALIVLTTSGIVFIASKSIVLSVVVGLVLSSGFFLLYKNNIEDKDNYEAPSINQWRMMWFAALFTHPILDSFTQYGTQLFAPFSDYRVSLNNISVADPIYTFLFIFGLVSAAFCLRQSPKRRFWNYLGIGLSSLYMIFTMFNRMQIKQVMVDTLQQEQIDYSRFTIGPVILNNVLWSGTVETDTAFLQGQYSWFDKEKKFKLRSIPKNHHLIADAKPDDHTINTLKWFSDQYYMVIKRRDGKLQFNDMRYGTFRGEGYDENDFIFRFIIEKKEDGYYEMLDEQGGPPEGSEDQMMKDLWDRIKGV